jgi:hypothetical protein
MCPRASERDLPTPNWSADEIDLAGEHEHLAVAGMDYCVASAPDCSGSQRMKDEIKFGDVASRLPARCSS